MKNELVSIIVPAYKCANYLPTCLDSLLNQTYQNVEIIVVYDPSPDNTLEILEKYQQMYPKKLKIIVQNEKTSPAKARNVGLRYAKGKFVGFCDADDFFHENKIKIQVQSLYRYKDKGVGLVYTDVVFVDKNGTKIGERRSPEWDFDRWLRYRFIIFSSILTFTSLARKVGGFNENLDAFDDFDFLLKMHSYTIFKRVPHLLTYYRLHQANLSKQIRKTIKNLFVIFLIHGYYRNAILEASVYTYTWIKNFPLIKLIRGGVLSRTLKIWLMRYRKSKRV